MLFTASSRYALPIRNCAVHHRKRNQNDTSNNPNHHQLECQLDAHAISFLETSFACMVLDSP